MDFEQRVMDKFDDMDKLLRSLCERTTKVEASLNNHYANIEKKNKSKERRFYYIIAMMGIGFTIQEIIRGVLFG